MSSLLEYKKVLIMAFLKEDGSLDIERINELHLEEFTKKIELMAEDEYNEFVSKQMINESQEPIRIIEVDYTIEEDIKNNRMVFILKMEQSY